MHKTLRIFHRVAGDAVVPFIDYACASLPTSRVSSTLSGMSEEEALAVLDHLEIGWEDLGYGPSSVVHPSSSEHGFLRAASQQDMVGISGLGGETLLRARPISVNGRPFIPDVITLVCKTLHTGAPFGDHLIQKTREFNLVFALSSEVSSWQRFPSGRY